MKTNILKIAICALVLLASFVSCTKDFEEIDITPQELKPHTHDSHEIDGDTDSFYVNNGKEERLTIRRDRIIIKANSEADAKELSKHPVFISAYPMSAVWVIGTIDPAETNLEDLTQIPGVINATYGLEYADGTMQFPKDIIYAELNGITAEEALNRIGRNGAVESAYLSNKYHNGYRITLDVKLSEILKICRELYESGVLEIVSPSFIREVPSRIKDTTDRPDSRSIAPLGATSGVDINLEDAWTITKGSPNIKIAVIDTGVDLTHPDLQANLLPGYDATTGAPGGENGGPWMDAFEANAHGTACAGIIGALDNGVGMTGVAPNCKIVPIRIGWYSYYGGYWDDACAADGINYAWETANADVLNNSWGRDGRGATSDEIDKAIDDALTKGRNRKGCVIVCSSGNNGIWRVMYPGNSRPEILAVGAVYNYRRYANEIGDDWSSNYGPELDVMAPGVNIHTTDIQGDVGYTTNNYHENFSGTSASAPYVSGIAALVLSVNPNLTGKQVADIIEWSAQEVGGYDYKTMYGRPNGPWHEEMGYGLVNAYRAVSFSNPLNLSNQTFYGNSTYSSWDISTRNITIAGGAKLSLKAPIITVNDGFRLEVGGSFEFNN